MARGGPAAAAVGARARRRHRGVLRPVPLRRFRVGYLPLGNADRIYDAVVRGADVLSWRLTGHHPARLDPGDAVGDAVHAGAGAGGGAGAGRPRPAGVRAVGLAAAGGGRAADPGRRAGRDGDAQPAGRGAAGRGDRLRLRRHLRVPRRTRPGADPVPGGDADAGDLRAGAADAARRGRPGRHRTQPVAARGAGAGGGRHRHHAGGVRDGRPHRRRNRRAAARRRLLPRARRQHRQRAAGRHPRLGHPRRDLGAAGRRDRCGVNGVPAQAVWRRAAGRRRRRAGYRPTAAIATVPPPATSPGCAAASCATRGTGPGAGGRHPDDLPAHHGAVGVLLLRRAQHTRRRLRRRTDRGAGAGAALSRRGTLRARGDAAAGRGQDPGRRPGPVRGHRGGVAAAGRAGAVVGGAAVRHSGARPGQAGHRIVLRPRRVPDRRRPGARRAAQPRRPGGRRDVRTSNRRRWRHDDDLPGSPGADRRPHQRGGVSAAGTQPDPNVVGAVADRQRRQPADPARSAARRAIRRCAAASATARPRRQIRWRRG